MKRILGFREALGFTPDERDNYNDTVSLLIIRDITMEPVFDIFLHYFGHYFGFSISVTYQDIPLFAPDMANRYDFVMLCLSEQDQLEKLLAFHERYLSIQKPVLLLAVDKEISVTEYFISIHAEKVRERLGTDHFYDLRGYYLNNMLFSIEGCRELAFETAAVINRLRGRAIKAIAVDCDNVLWGGEISELGIEGIHLGQLGMGKAYQDFQKELLSLQKQGILLILLSKNDEDTVRQIFEQHPDMILRWEHITAHGINWQPKPENLDSIASELNLGLESFLFIDDSIYEIELMKKHLPQVKLLHVNPEQVWRYRSSLRDCGWLPGSGIHHDRTNLYQEQKQRRDSQKKFVTLEEYHRSLETIVTVSKAKPFHLPRLAELSLRTNQFNLTGKRYSQPELNALINDPLWDIYVLSAKDKFGDMGIVSFAVTRSEKSAIHIEAFFLSCRVFGRHFERVLLSRIGHKASKDKGACLYGYYVQTEKNRRFASFWKDNGFHAQGDVFYHKLDQPIEYPNQFKEVIVIS